MYFYSPFVIVFVIADGRQYGRHVLQISDSPERFVTRHFAKVKIDALPAHTGA